MAFGKCTVPVMVCFSVEVRGVLEDHTEYSYRKAENHRLHLHRIYQIAHLRVKENPVTTGTFFQRKKGAYARSTSIGPVLRHIQPAGYSRRLPPQSLLDYLTSRMSSMYTVPVPPAAGVFLVPKPTVTALTLVRSTPAKSCRSTTHSFHPLSCVALKSS